MRSRERRAIKQFPQARNIILRKNKPCTNHRLTYRLSPKNTMPDFYMGILLIYYASKEHPKRAIVQTKEMEMGTLLITF